MRVKKISRSNARLALRVRRLQRRAVAVAAAIPERRHLMQQGALALAGLLIAGGIYAIRDGKPAAKTDLAAATAATAATESKTTATEAGETKVAAVETTDPAATTVVEKSDTPPTSETATANAAPRIRFDAPPVEPIAAKETPNTSPAPAAAAAPSAPEVAAPAAGPAKSAPSLSFRDTRALEPIAPAPAAPASTSQTTAPAAPSQTAAPAAASQQPATPNFSLPAAPSFRDNRAIDTKPATDTAAAGPAAAGSLFRDNRTLEAKPRFAAPDALPSTSFRDDRRLATPSFKDPRPAETSLFQDTRPAAGVTFKDERTLTAEATPAATPATPAPETKTDNAEGSKPFDVGYFLGDRSPMARQLEPEAQAPPSPAASAASSATPSSTPAAAAQPPSPQPAAPADGSLPTLVALAPGQLKLDGIACVAPEVTTEPLDGGLMRMRITANCHPNEFVQISYGGAEFIRKLNTYGALDFVLDCFAGSSSAVEVRFADGVTRQVSVTAKDLDKVSKIAVVWRAGVNLDLHVFEYAAKFGETGHYWANAPSTFLAAQVQGQADQRGHGFLSAVDDDKTLGDKLEVYTFLHSDQQTSGAISLALDNATRGETPSGPTCGQGALAEIGFQVSILPRNAQVTRQSGVLTRVECGTKLTHEARFNQSAMPGLRIRR